jgi:hypothetical protein
MLPNRQVSMLVIVSEVYVFVPEIFCHIREPFLPLTD